MTKGLVTSRARTSAFQMHGLDFNHSDRDFDYPVRPVTDYIWESVRPTIPYPTPQPMTNLLQVIGVIQSSAKPGAILFTGSLEVCPSGVGPSPFF